MAGKALRDAPPAAGERFPLVIVSHGYPGSRTFLLYLTENLASKGYIVAGIDHTDSVFGEVKAFTSTLLNRMNDQLFTIAALEQRPGFLSAILDGSRVAVVGYSMGGYGALATAGAGYSRNSAAMSFVPGGYFAELTAGNPKFAARRRDAIKALVAIAPWGAQPPYNAWDDQGLAGIRIPSLFIAGDQDDVSDYRNGISKAFQKAVNSDRCMLTYENARHNVGGNPPPSEALSSFEAREFFDEPAWRKDRITAINQHFITAFLDLYLKGDESRRVYLHVSPEKSNDGTWPLPPAGGEKKYWKGFQRRWAVGMEMHCEAGVR
jgi:predicted dienelactone hydrolase